MVTEKSYMQEFIDAPYPENVNPHAYYQLQKRLERLGYILVRCNCKRLTNDEAIHAVCNLFPLSIKKAWNEYLLERKERKKT